MPDAYNCGNNLGAGMLRHSRRRSRGQKCRYPGAATGPADRPAREGARLNPARRLPIGVIGRVSSAARRSIAGVAAGGRGKQQLVIVAGRREPRRQIGLLLRQTRRRPRKAAAEANSTVAADARCLADMPEIGDQPVRHVAHGMRDAGEARPEPGARLGQLKARDQQARARPGRAANTRRATPSARDRRRRSCR